MQERIELSTGFRIGIALEGDAELPDRLDQLEGLVPFLLANRVTEQLTE